MEAERKIDVFVSYAAPDRERVRPLVDSLHGAGLQVWWDPRIAPGTGFDAEIQAALDAARCVLVVWSQHSVTSEWVITEADEGSERNILVPVSIDDVKPPLAFRRRQTISVRNHENAAELIVKAIRGVLSGEQVEVPVPAGTREQNRFGRLLGALALGAIFGAALTFYFIAGKPQSSVAKDVEVRIPLELPSWVGMTTGSRAPVRELAISPSGDSVVFSAVDETAGSVLKIRRLDDLTTTALEGTEGGFQPFYSPDGHWVGFFAGEFLLKRVSIDGGDPSIITSLVDWPAGASWGDGDQIVFAEGLSGFSTIAANGGDRRPLTQLDPSRKEYSHRYPHHLPGHPILLYAVLVADRGHEIWALNLQTGERRYLVDGLAPSYLASGHIMFAISETQSQGSLWRVPFDAEAMSVTGPAELVQGATGGREGSAYAVAPTGTLVYLPSQGALIDELLAQDADRSQVVLDQGPSFYSPRFSTDGESVAVTVTELGKRPSLWIYNVRTGAKRRLSDHAEHPLWSPDDRSIVFMRDGTGLLRRQVDGKSAPEVLVDHNLHIYAAGWLGGGEDLLYNKTLVEDGRQTGHLFVRGSDGTSRELTTSQEADDYPIRPAVTRDERWMAYCTGMVGVKIGTFPKMANVNFASKFGCSPRWSADEKKLLFEEGGTVWEVPVEIEDDEVSLGNKVRIVETGSSAWPLYDIDRRGRLVYVRRTFESPKPPVLMLNWEVNLTASL